MRNQKIRRYIPSRHPTGAWDDNTWDETIWEGSEDDLDERLLTNGSRRRGVWHTMRSPEAFKQDCAPMVPGAIRSPIELKAYLRFRVLWHSMKVVLVLVGGVFVGSAVVYLTLDALVSIAELLKRIIGG